MIQKRKGEKGKMIEVRKEMPMVATVGAAPRQPGRRLNPVLLIGFILILLFALLLHLFTPNTPSGSENTASVVTPEVIPVTE